MVSKKKKFVFGIIFIYIITAIFSNGYHHPDEHYQLIEFAGLKGGWNSGADLTWEYDSQIRPALQPMLALGIFKFLGIFGIKDPFTLATGLRLFTALLSLFCIRRLVRSVMPDIQESNRKAFVLLSCLLWFLPAINVRFSSETWAGLMTLLSVAGLYQTCPRTRLFYIAIGVLWGLSFEFRYQMAAALSGLLLWLIFVRKEKYRHLLYILSGSLGVVLLCTVLDSWYYGNPVFAPWNYFKCNIIDGVASHFGTSPWYFYPDAIWNRPTPLIGILISLALIIFLIRDYRHILVWVLVPFLALHSLIPHKELRFLFPVVNYIPLILVLAYRAIPQNRNRKTAKAILYPVFAVALLINVGGLVMLAFKPASDGNIEILRHLNRNYDRANLYTIAWSNPYSLNSNVKGLTPRFYANDKITVKNLSEILEYGSEKKPEDDDLVMLLANYHERAYLEKLGFVEEKRSIPLWIEKIDKFYQVFNEYQFIFVLYSKPDDKKN
jgi:phosphatidylinositol glycan class B